MQLLNYLEVSSLAFLSSLDTTSNMSSFTSNTVNTIEIEMQEEKHYLVKYKGLAHVHNRWIPESQMLLETPKLVAKFNRRLQKGKVAYILLLCCDGQFLLSKYGFLCKLRCISLVYVIQI